MRQGGPKTPAPRSAAAIAAGYGIEIDVQLSADGRAMVFHDDTLGPADRRDRPGARAAHAELGGSRC
jgi:glycerophosphoryl diester phosphodiesterase